MGRSHSVELDRFSIHGDGSVRYGVLHNLDVFLLKEGNVMALVIGILIITVILWWPRKKGE